jgi:DnaJ family protein C protein 1
MALMLLCIISICALFSPGHSWSQDELNLFDLVEELNEDFYSLLQVPKDASASEIRKAYRKLSLQYHPDKNRDDPNAGETFRKLGAVADVLKDDYMREIYNDILENGLPDWKQPVYYYRKVKKMTFFEIMIVLFVISIIGQFLYGWAQYLEKQLVLVS